MSWAAAIAAGADPAVDDAAFDDALAEALAEPPPAPPPRAWLQRPLRGLRPSRGRAGLPVIRLGGPRRNRFFVEAAAWLLEAGEHPPLPGGLLDPAHDPRRPGPKLEATARRVLLATLEGIDAGGFTCEAIDTVARRAGLSRVTVHRTWTAFERLEWCTRDPRSGNRGWLTTRGDGVIQYTVVRRWIWLDPVIEALGADLRRGDVRDPARPPVSPRRLMQRLEAWLVAKWNASISELASHRSFAKDFLDIAGASDTARTAGAAASRRRQAWGAALRRKLRSPPPRAGPRLAADPPAPRAPISAAVDAELAAARQRFGPRPPPRRRRDAWRWLTAPGAA